MSIQSSFTCLHTCPHACSYTLLFMCLRAMSSSHVFEPCLYNAQCELHMSACMSIHILYTHLCTHVSVHVHVHQSYTYMCVCMWCTCVCDGSQSRWRMWIYSNGGCGYISMEDVDVSQWRMFGISQWISSQPSKRPFYLFGSDLGHPTANANARRANIANISSRDRRRHTTQHRIAKLCQAPT